ncbi:MAG: hypothetical protein ACYTEQ_15885 [Planctomycetota bacterium]|jgi:hypothetical protein
MSVRILKAFQWGVDEEIIAAGAGAGAVPQVVSAVSTAPDKVRITFNQPMNEASMGRFQDYRIVALVGGARLGVVGLEPVSVIEVDLITDAQKNVNYEVTVTRVVDAWDVPINNAANNTAQFGGTDEGTVFPTVTTKNTFYGLESGMQGAGHPDFLPDVTGPVLQNRVPGPSDTDVAVDANFVLEIVDADNLVDANTVLLQVAGVTAWQSDAQQNGFVVTKTPVGSGYRYEINPPTDRSSFETVIIHVEATDTAPLPNVTNTDYSFRIVDLTTPYLTAQAPAPSETNVTPLANVELSVLDDGDGVDVATVVITIEGVVAWSGDALQNGFTGTKAIVAGGFHYDLTPPIPFPAFTTIDVEVQADDTAPVPNSLNTSYTFETTADIAPQFENLSPAAGAFDVADDQGIAFDVRDNISVDEPTVLIFINEVLAYEASVAKNGFTVQKTVIPFGFHYEITGPTNWRYGSAVTVAGSARDHLNTLGSRTWSIQIIEDPACFSGPINIFEATLLTPYTLADTALRNAEGLRRLLLDSLVDLEHPTRAVRIMFLRAHSTELAPILRQLVPEPTPRELAVKLCRQRSNIDVELDLRRKPWLIPGALNELADLGLPQKHRELLTSYVIESTPNTIVPLACLIVFLAKALENNELI